jgi:hypothetical protein
MSEAQPPVLTTILQLLNIEPPAKEAGQVGQGGQPRPPRFAPCEVLRSEPRDALGAERDLLDPVDRLDRQSTTDGWKRQPGAPVQSPAQDFAEGPILAALAWRIAAMRPHVPERGALPFLRARQGVPTGAASCWSCAERLPANRRYRCSLCARAAWIVVHRVREGIDG